MPHSSVETLARSVAGTFPACDDAPLARSLLRELAKGEPLATSTLHQRAHAALARWPNVAYDDHGRVVAFSGLSLTPTDHRFKIGGRDLYAWCAWDTLFLPAMLGESADVESRCPITGADVRLTVTPNEIVDADPPALGVSFPPPSRASSADITGTFCRHVHFLAGRAAADRWLRRHPAGIVLELDDAYELGRVATRCFTD